MTVTDTQMEALDLAFDHALIQCAVNDLVKDVQKIHPAMSEREAKEKLVDLLENMPDPK